MSNDANIEYGNQIAQILGIPNCRDIELYFPMHGAAWAKVDFLINNVQAQAIVQLLEGTKWGNNPLPPEPDMLTRG